MQEFVSAAENIRVAILESGVPLAMRIHGSHEPHDQPMPWPDVVPDQLFSLYPYSATAAVTYLVEAVAVPANIWTRRIGDVLQYKIDLLNRVSVGSGRLLREVYGYNGFRFPPNDVSLDPLFQACKIRDLRWELADALPMLYTLNCLQLAVTGKSVVYPNLTSPDTVHRLLGEFTRAFNRF